MPAVLEEVESQELQAAYTFARSGPEECYGIIAGNNPVNLTDPMGLYVNCGRAGMVSPGFICVHVETGEYLGLFEIFDPCGGWRMFYSFDDSQWNRYLRGGKRI